LIGQQFEGVPQRAKGYAMFGSQTGLGWKGCARGPLSIDHTLPYGRCQGSVSALTRFGLD